MTARNTARGHDDWSAVRKVLIFWVFLAVYSGCFVASVTDHPLAVGGCFVSLVGGAWFDVSGRWARWTR